MSGRFWLILLLTVVAVVMVGIKLLTGKTVQSYGQPTLELRTLKISEALLEVELANEAHEMEIGLGGRQQLPENRGMLFVYPSAVIPRYWMKDMRFNLDFIWIHDEKVVDITQNVPAPRSSSEQLPFYSPKTAITMVLEVNAGYVDAHNIMVGDLVRLQ